MNAARTYLAAEPNGLATSWDPPTNFAKLENSPNWLKNPHRLWLENKIRIRLRALERVFCHRWRIIKTSMGVGRQRQGCNKGRGHRVGWAQNNPVVDAPLNSLHIPRLDVVFRPPKIWTHSKINQNITVFSTPRWKLKTAEKAGHFQLMTDRFCH